MKPETRYKFTLEEHMFYSFNVFLTKPACIILQITSFMQKVIRWINVTFWALVEVLDMLNIALFSLLNSWRTYFILSWLGSFLTIVFFKNLPLKTPNRVQKESPLNRVMSASPSVSAVTTTEAWRHTVWRTRAAVTVVKNWASVLFSSVRRSRARYGAQLLFTLCSCFCR